MGRAYSSPSIWENFLASQAYRLLACSPQASSTSLLFAGPWPRACQITDFWKGTISNNFCNYLSFFVSDSIKKLTIFQKWTQK